MHPYASRCHSSPEKFENLAFWWPPPFEISNFGAFSPLLLFSLSEACLCRCSVTGLFCRLRALLHYQWEIDGAFATFLPTPWSPDPQCYRQVRQGTFLFSGRWTHWHFGRAILLGTRHDSLRCALPYEYDFVALSWNFSSLDRAHWVKCLCL